MKTIRAIGLIVAWIRFLLVIAILYAFFYEYLIKKYQIIINQFDDFYIKKPRSGYQNLNQIFNFTFSSFKGDSFSTENKNQQLFSQIGAFSEFSNSQYQRSKQVQFSPSNTIDDILKALPLVKKVDNYLWNFYNWYTFELTFVDIGHDSYLQFRLVEEKKGKYQVAQKLPFELPDHFYPRNSSDHDNTLDIKFNTSDFSLNVSQFTVPSHYHDFNSDGLQNDKFFWLSQNKSQITDLDYLKFGSSKTLTKFNLFLKRKDYEIKVTATHVIRHNQCLTNFQNSILKHKCMGGYGQGRIGFSYFVRNEMTATSSTVQGSWHRQTYNLDNSRVRTAFIGYRSAQSYVSEYFPHFEANSKKNAKWNHKSIQIDFVGFNKLEYYSKKDKIQKQRWVGMTLYQSLQQNGAPIQNSHHQNYFFVNGNIHPIYEIDLNIPLGKDELQKGKFLYFKNDLSMSNFKNQTPSFEIEFQIFNSTLVQQDSILNRRQVLRLDGFWSGWIDESTLFQDQLLKMHYNKTAQFGHVGFYNITGTIKIQQDVY